LIEHEEVKADAMMDCLPAQYDTWRRQVEQIDQRALRQSSYYGDFAVTSSFDSTAKVWGTGDWKQLCQLAGHENKVMDVDLSRGTWKIMKNIFHIL
jgi:hypothetical protein